MKRKDDTIAILFVTFVTVVIWFWAAGKTKYESEVTTAIRFKAPEGSISTISPQSSSIKLMLSGPKKSVDAVKKACEQGLDLPIATEDGIITLQELPTLIGALDAFWNKGVVITSTVPASFTLAMQTMIQVEASVEAVLPGVMVSGDVTIDHATVMLKIPKSIGNAQPEAITVEAYVSIAALEQLQPGVVYTRDAVIRLPADLEGSDVIVEPNRVSVTFKIQSKTEKTVLPQVRVLIAGPAEDYAAYSISLPRTIVTNVTIEADAEIISGIDSGNVKVYAVIRLASSDMEQRISSKTITTFLAIMEDGTGHELQATVEDPTLLEIELVIEPIAITTP